MTGRGSAGRPLGAAVGDEVTLRGMRFHALVGILPHERTIPQPLEIDVTAIVRRGAVVDYRGIYDAAHAAVDTGALEYLEHIAEDVATRVLALDSVFLVRVAVRKPHVALPGPLDHAEVVIERAHGA
jgi:dihydroneopterin aldolase